MNPRIRAAIFATVLGLSGCTAPATQAQLFARGGSAPSSFAPLVKQVLPAVVNISTLEAGQLGGVPPELRGTPFERMLRERVPRRAVRGAGSGFIIDPSGIIVTNSHVVGHANRITVSLSDGTEMQARLVGIDELTDIAVIRVAPSAPLPAVRWGDSRTLEVGDWILAAGNPFGVGVSVTAGIVSARGREIGAGPFDDFLQIDAPINPGNSGGPTFNMGAEVVGVNTAIVSPTGGSVGIGFAVPSEVARKVVDDLLTRGRVERGWLGVSVQDAGDGQGGRAVEIANVDRTGPAARAGLRPGDVVVAVNGAKVDSTQSLIRAVASVSPGNSVRVTVRRGGQSVDVPVTVGRRPTEQLG